VIRVNNFAGRVKLRVNHDFYLTGRAHRPDPEAKAVKIHQRTKIAGPRQASAANSRIYNVPIKSVNCRNFS